MRKGKNLKVVKLGTFKQKKKVGEDPRRIENKKI